MSTVVITVAAVQTMLIVLSNVFCTTSWTYTIAPRFIDHVSTRFAFPGQTKPTLSPSLIYAYFQFVKKRLYNGGLGPSIITDSFPPIICWLGAVVP